MFPDGLSVVQRDQLEAYAALLRTYNRSLNLISRASVPRLEVQHLQHSLALVRRAFPDDCDVADWGTGGGLPGIPLAICFPRVRFHLVDATSKKIMAVRAMTRALGLQNIETWDVRAEAWPGQVHYAVSRATAPLVDLWKWYLPVQNPEPIATGPADWPLGLICLKGGDLSAEIAALRAADPAVQVQVHALSAWLHDPFFETKCIVQVTRDAPV